MQINTKLSCGQIAWFIHKNEVVSRRVESITVKVVSSSLIDKEPPMISIQYGFREWDVTARGNTFKAWLELYENKVFASKGELLASL